MRDGSDVRNAESFEENKTRESRMINACKMSLKGAKIEQMMKLRILMMERVITHLLS